MPNDHLHPLIRARKILVEVFGQLQQLADFYESAGWDSQPLKEEVRRIHLRLIKIQMEIEKHELD